MFDDGDFVRVNPWTKEIYGLQDKDLCADKRISSEVREIYYKNQEMCNRFLEYYSLPEFEPNDRRFYVYAWHTDTIPKKYFYVGKGTNSRYRHILWEIEKYRSGEKKNNSRFKSFALLQDKFGIDCEIVLNNLSSYEALIYEQALKVKMASSGEVLLNVEGVPTEDLPPGWQSRRTEIPMIENSAFYRRYFEYPDIPHFDEVDFDYLTKNYFYLSGIGRGEIISEEKRIISEWTKNNSGKTYSTGTAKGVRSIIVLCYLSEERYRAFRNEGKKIYSSVDVIKAITNST